MAHYYNLKFNGVQMPNPKVGGVSYSRNKIWSQNTGRDTNGNMVGTIIGIKDKLEITWDDITQAQASLIDGIVSNPNMPFTTVTFVGLDGLTKTMQAYFGDVSYGIEKYDSNRKQQIYNGLSVSTIQQ